MASRRKRKVGLQTDVNRSDRDAKGLFVPGCAPGPGRPPGAVLDFRAIVEAKAKELGVSREQAVWEVNEALLLKAKAGDAVAAKLWLDRNCGKDEDKMQVTRVGEQMTDEERERRVAEIIDRINGRKPSTTSDG